MKPLLTHSATYLRLLLCMLLCSNAVLADSPAYKPCTQKDVVGTWNMLSQVSKTSINPKDAFYYPFQRYVFTEDGVLKHLTSTKIITDQQKALQAKSPVSSTYLLNPKGLMLVSRKDSNKKQVLLCTMILESPSGQKNQGPQKGDLLISYLSVEGQPPTVQRLLRKEK